MSPGAEYWTARPGRVAWRGVGCVAWRVMRGVAWGEQGGMSVVRVELRGEGLGAGGAYSYLVLGMDAWPSRPSLPAQSCSAVCAGSELPFTSASIGWMGEECFVFWLDMGNEKRCGRLERSVWNGWTGGKG